MRNKSDERPVAKVYTHRSGWDRQNGTIPDVQPDTQTRDSGEQARTTMKTTNRKATAPAAGVLVLVLALALTGCGSKDKTATPVPGHTPTASAPGSLPVGDPKPVVVPVPDPSGSFAPFTGEAADQFGADNVMTAYKFATKFMLQSTFDGTLITLTQPRQVDFSTVEQGLTPGAKTSFRALTALLESKTENLTPQQASDLVALTTWGVNTFPGYTLRNPGYRNVGFGAAHAEVAKLPGRQDELILRFPVTGTFLLTDSAGKLAVVDYKKDMDLSLAESGDPAHPWLIDGWRGTRTSDGPKVDPKP